MDNAATGLMGLLVSGLNPLQVLWYQFLLYIPHLMAGAIILIIAWIFATLLGNLTKRFVRYSGADKWMHKTGLAERLQIEHGSRYARFSYLVGTLVQWLIVLAGIGIAAQVANLPTITLYVSEIFAFIPNIFVATLILCFGFIGAAYASDFAAATVTATGISETSRETLTTIIKYAIMIFAIMAALTELRIVPELIEILFAGLVLALALAFGLGGRDHASDAIRRMREQS